VIRYSQVVYLPRFGVEIALTRTQGQRWWVVGTSEQPGSVRVRESARRPRNATAVTAFATAQPPFTLRRKRKRKRR